jgi:hypothetical protein
MSSAGDDSIPDASAAQPTESEVPVIPSPHGAAPHALAASSKLSVAQRVSHFRTMSEQATKQPTLDPQHQRHAQTTGAAAPKFKVAAVIHKCPVCTKAVYQVQPSRSFNSDDLLIQSCIRWKNYTPWDTSGTSLAFVAVVLAI